MVKTPLNIPIVFFYFVLVLKIISIHCIVLQLYTRITSRITLLVYSSICKYLLYIVIVKVTIIYVDVYYYILVWYTT